VVIIKANKSSFQPQFQVFTCIIHAVTHLSIICELICLENVGALMSQPSGFSQPVTGIALPFFTWTGWNIQNLKLRILPTFDFEDLHVLPSLFTITQMSINEEWEKVNWNQFNSCFPNITVNIYPTWNKAFLKKIMWRINDRHTCDN
jgi:hypothetical protein